MVDRVEKEVDELDIENSVQDMEEILERFLFLIINSVSSSDPKKSVKVQFKSRTFAFTHLLLNILHFECW